MVLIYYYGKQVLKVPILKEEMLRLKEQAKSMLRPYLESQGINTNKNFSCLSKEHTDSNPSMIYNKSTNTVYCFGCGEHGDIFDVIRMQYGIPRDDYKTIFETAYRILGINTHIHQNKNIYSEKKIELSENRREDDKEKELDLTEFFKKAESLINQTDYAQKRGLTDEIIKRFHLGFDPEWINPKLDEETRKRIKPSPRLIIPTSKHSYLARNTKENLTENEKKYSKIKVGKIRIFNREILNKTNSPVFVVEGEIDAMSIMVAGGEAVALGSASNTELFIKECKKNPPKMPLIICADNDEIGKKAMIKLCLGLAREKIPFVYSNISKNFKDANERLINDFKGLNKDISLETEHLNNSFNLKIQKEYIKNKDFHRAYSFCKTVTRNISSEECQLGFMKEVVKIYGTNGDMLKAAIEAITNFENEDFRFKVRLLSDTLKTREYKSAFDSKNKANIVYPKVWTTIPK